MNRAFTLKIDKSLRERRRIMRLLDFLKRDDLTGEQMERIGRRLQKSGKRALKPLVRKVVARAERHHYLSLHLHAGLLRNGRLDGSTDPDYPAAHRP